MDHLLRLREKGSFSPQKRRKWLILMAVFGVSGYGVYRVYNSPSVVRKRKRLMKLLGGIVSIAELVIDSAETISIVSRDLKGFLESDSDEIPNSLKQIAKLTKSREFTDYLARVSEAMTIGVFRGYNLDQKSKNLEESGIRSNSSVVDQVADKVFSKEGSGFISAVVGSFAKNLVLGFYSDEIDPSGTTTTTPRWVNLLCDEKCRELLADCIERFTNTAVSVYIEKTVEINTYDQIFAGLTNPKHRDSTRDMLVSVCNGAIETLMRTSHEVFTTSSKSDSGSSCSIIDESEETDSNRKDSVDRFKNNGWVEAISTTLAVPSNRKFMFDVTGRVTVETMRSIMEFIILKTSQSFKKSFNVIHEEVTDRGRQVVGYVGAKSSVILTVCLAIYLHIINRCVRGSPVFVNQHLQSYR